MHALCLAVALALAPDVPADVVEVQTTPEQAAAVLAPQIQTGSLLLSRGDCLAIKVFTASPFTHVATVVAEQGELRVYDSMNGVGVRRLSLAEYLAVQSPDRLHVLNPAKPFDPPRTAAFVAHLERELGRPYAIRHHLTGDRCDGLHCAEYATDALTAARVVRAEKPPRVSPGSLAEGVLAAQLYVAGPTLKIVAADPVPPPETDGWCGRCWFDTKQCTSRCCRQLSRWFLCR